METLLHYWPICLFVLNGVMAWFIWSMRQSFATRQDLEDVHDSVDKVAQRVELVERDMMHLPTKDQLHSLMLQMEGLSGALETARADYRHVLDGQRRVEAVLTRHEQIFSDAARMK